MAATERTRISSKGQVVLPVAIRRARQWASGTTLTIEDTPDGVLLRAATLFPPTVPDEVFGMLKYDGPTVTLEEMNAAVDSYFAGRALD